MRKEAKTRVTNKPERSIQGYHACSDYSNRINYAFDGFITENRYYTSDRYIVLRQVERMLTRPDGKPLCGYGLEIETECRGTTNEQMLATILYDHVFDVMPDGLIKLQHDGSLGGDSSAECITQIMTEAFIRNHYAEWKFIFDRAFPAFGITAGHVSCGMHVNISNACFGASEDKQAAAIKKLFYIINRNFDFACVLLNRDRRRTHYCAQAVSAAEAWDYVTRRRVDQLGAGHGVCFNTSHFTEGRVELRLVGGCASFGAFRNTMESVFFLVNRVKRLSWNDCDNLVKVFAGCNQYVYDRLTKCRTSGVLDEATLAAIRETVVREDLI